MSNRFLADQDGGYVNVNCPADAPRRCRGRVELTRLGHLPARALGYSLTAVIRIRPAPRQLQKAADLARSTPEVVDCRRITGEDCFFMTAHLRDVEHLEQVIDLFIAHGSRPRR